jgi:hypothetical protein
MILRLLGYNSEYIGDRKYLGQKYHRWPGNKKDYFKSLKLPIDLEKNNYFIVSIKYMHDYDRYILDTHNLEFIKAINQDYLYKFILQ